VFSLFSGNFCARKRRRRSGFDLIYATLAALAGEIGFILFHQDLFVNDWLTAVALWVVPGLSLWRTDPEDCIVLSRSYRVRLGYVLDSFALAFPAALIVGKIGSLLDRSEVGVAASLRGLCHSSATWVYATHAIV
jgi:hypothetical protein